MDYETYKAAVMDAVICKHGQKYKKFCTDSVRESFNEKRTIEKATEHVYDDTMYWAGDWSCPK